MKRYSTRVPSEYQELAELRNTGTQYIDTGLLGSDMNGCELEIVMRNDPNNTTYFNFNGTYMAGSTAQFGLVATSDTLCRASMNFGFTEAIITPDLTNHQYHTLYVESGLQKVDDITVGTLSFGTLNGNSFLLFARTQAEGGVNIASGMSLKSFTVKRNGEYVRNMIPVRRKSDSVLGLYDMANDVFYTNQGTGDFIAGSNVNNYIWQTINPPRYGTDTDIITDLPQKIITDGQPIGANLFDGDLLENGWNINENGTLVYDVRRIATTTPIDVTGLTSVTLTFKPSNIRFIYATFKNGVKVSRTAENASGTTIDVSDCDSLYICFYRGSETITKNDVSEIMLNTGSTALPYQPYSPAIIKGNMVQSDTPSPSSIIMPSECGDKTVNLFPLDENKLHVGRIENDGTIDYQIGTITVGTDSVSYQSTTTWRGFYTDFIQVNENEQLTFSSNTAATIAWSCSCYDENDSFLGKASAQSTASTRTFTLFTGTKKVRMSVTSSETSYTISQPMLVSGSTAPTTYIPYGYVLPVQTGSTTTPVYLGQVQTTRRIKKVVLTGEEDWNWYEGASSAAAARAYCYLDIANSIGYAVENQNICSHFIADRISINNENIGFGVQNRNSDNKTSIIFRYSPYTSTLNDFKTYLQQQYSAGIPVCVWYVLATETSDIVNEPIRKIGNYADSLSVTGIPTTAGRQTFDVNTTLKPSEVNLTYHGWHRDQPKIKSKNLFDPNSTRYHLGKGTNNRVAPLENGAMFCIAAKSNTSYSIKVNTTDATFVRLYLSNAPLVEGTAESYQYVAETETVTNPETTISNTDNTYLWIQVGGTWYTNHGGSSIMLNEGSSALPYEPYWIED